MTTTRADLHDELDAEQQQRWSHFGHWEQPYFPNIVGIQFEEVRKDYARARIPFRKELHQPAGVVHGGVTATLIDTVVVPAIASAYEQVPVMLTIDMQIRYLGAVRDGDLVAEGWITKRGRSVVFCQAEVRDASTDEPVAEGWMTYRVIDVPARAEGEPARMPARS
jgi:uncharacterized protein (TIGR00369 family)